MSIVVKTVKSTQNCEKYPIVSKVTKHFKSAKKSTKKGQKYPKVSTVFKTVESKEKCQTIKFSKMSEKKVLTVPKKTWSEGP